MQSMQRAGQCLNHRGPEGAAVAVKEKTDFHLKEIVLNLRAEELLLLMHSEIL